MNERTLEILEAAVRDYIRAGIPVTSERIYRTHNFGIKPAMIRWELNDLSDAGYLLQIHHSGGRVPTDKAYRYFAEKTLEEVREGENTSSPRSSGFLGYLKDEDEGMFVEKMSHYLKSFGIGYVPHASQIYESGLLGLFERLPMATHSELLQIVRDLERLPDRLEALKDEWFSEDGWPKVFVGESPLTSSTHLSVIAHRIKNGDSEFVFLSVGPKRMDYEKSIRTISRLNSHKKLKSKKNGRKKSK